MKNTEDKKNDETTGFFTRDGGDLVEQFDRGVFAYYYGEYKKSIGRKRKQQSKRRRINNITKYNANRRK